ncbi:tRNA (N6-threonylcarbamoyladenosine(37)-N6)-methyltransferase TrmO [Anaerolineales bacterium HSG6]|nr:tRNA (N6-threonylcarbamoyladenosine(37)-N6)-methyltransferase TrmO [Anaerolineales bacterium HSG6]
MPMPHTMQPIGIIHSCFKEKFGIPRQAGLAPSARATLELLPPYNRPEALTGLDGFSHVWLLFIFHGNQTPQNKQRKNWKPTVRPPRLGGNKRLGVFATRSTYRPNSVGLSAVELLGYGQESGRLVLQLGGVDLLDETPVIDIKPYLPYSDSIPTATGGFAPSPPAETMTIEFTPSAEAVCQEIEQTIYPNFRRLVSQILKDDPRPAYYGTKPQKNRFGIKLLDFDLQWQVEENKGNEGNEGNKIVVLDVKKITA